MARTPSRILVVAALALSAAVPPTAHAFDLKCQAAIPALEATAAGLKVTLAATKASLPTLKKKAVEAAGAAQAADKQATLLEARSSASPADEALRKQAREARLKASSLKSLSATSSKALAETEKRLPGLQDKLAAATKKLAAERARCNKA